jgi:hypothetical protein
MLDDIKPDSEKLNDMATAPVTREAPKVRPRLTRAELINQFFLALMIICLTLGVFLPVTWSGILNVSLLIASAYSGYRVFAGNRV